MFTFGNLTSLYSIMQDKDKNAIAKLYRTTDFYFNSWIRLLQVYGRIYVFFINKKRFMAIFIEKIL